MRRVSSIPRDFFIDELRVHLRAFRKVNQNQQAQPAGEDPNTLASPKDCTMEEPVESENVAAMIKEINVESNNSYMLPQMTKQAFERR